MKVLVKYSDVVEGQRGRWIAKCGREGGVRTSGWGPGLRTTDVEIRFGVREGKHD